MGLEHVRRAPGQGIQFAGAQCAGVSLGRHGRVGDSRFARRSRVSATEETPGRPKFLIPLGGRTTYVVGLGALMRKRTAARSFLIPLGGRATYLVGLGALPAPRFIDQLDQLDQLAQF